MTNVCYMPITYPNGRRQQMQITWSIACGLACKAMIARLTMNDVMLQAVREYAQATAPDPTK